MFVLFVFHAFIFDALLVGSVSISPLPSPPSIVWRRLACRMSFNKWNDFLKEARKILLREGMKEGEDVELEAKEKVLS